MRISDWSSDVCSSDLPHPVFGREEVVPALAMATQSQTVPLAVLRMHLLDPPAPALDVFVGRNGEDAAQMFGPIDGAPAHVPVPETLGRTFDRQGEPLLAFAERGLRTLAFGDRSEERRVGKEWVSTCRSRRSPFH